MYGEIKFRHHVREYMSSEDIDIYNVSFLGAS